MTLHQKPEKPESIEDAIGWGILHYYRGVDGGLLEHTVHPSRSAAIKDYDDDWNGPGAYRRDRRAGRVRAVRVRVTILIDEA
ncbi:hypothetical protein ACEYYA_00775 [Paracoccus sp. p3-h83]|uniref:hypothetical protein n=1 Tax=Paracoccus sp. p3-h83 TaxID=3342805 RepID=UPI0035B82BA9